MEIGFELNGMWINWSHAINKKRSWVYLGESTNKKIESTEDTISEWKVHDYPVESIDIVLSTNEDWVDWMDLESIGEENCCDKFPNQHFNLLVCKFKLTEVLKNATINRKCGKFEWY